MISMGGDIMMSANGLGDPLGDDLFLWAFGMISKIDVVVYRYRNTACRLGDMLERVDQILVGESSVNTL